MVDNIETTNVLQVYSKIANHFNDTRQYKWLWIEKFVKKYNKTDVLYDIGCGSGRNLSENIIGVDNCDEFLSICKNKGHNVRKGCMTELPFNDMSCDGIISIASFHHLSTHQRRLKALKEMKRVLRNNNKEKNKILLSVWSIEQPEKTRRRFKYGDNFVSWNKNGEIYNRYYYIFKKDELINLFNQAGLCIVSHEWYCGNEVFILQ